MDDSGLAPPEQATGKEQQKSKMAGPGTQGSFVVRIWLEGESREDPTWRGHIRHVQGEDESYFQNLTEMKEFLERISGVPLPANNKLERFRDE